MRVCRTIILRELHKLPLDACDMFLMSRLDSPLALVDLAEIAPCGIVEAMDRVRALVVMGVLELLVEDHEQPTQHSLEYRRRYASSLQAEAPVPSAYSSDSWPPTGVRERPDLDAPATTKVAIGVLKVGCERPRAAVEAASCEVEERRRRSAR